MPQPRVMLVMTGDNFGYCISHMSLLVNATAAKEAADLAKRHNIPIGLHANLSEGIPMCQSKKQVSTLLTNVVFSMDWFPSGSGARPAQHEKGLFHCFPSQVELELGAQHVHVLSPFDSFVCVCEVFAQVLSDFWIPYTRVQLSQGYTAVFGCLWDSTQWKRTLWMPFLSSHATASRVCACVHR
uniref:Carbohydrate deacetylase n=1 Tax=Cynoglossus semilaevis TaxID=244447 RepID=A0A3P8WPR2_CYNSE